MKPATLAVAIFALFASAVDLFAQAPPRPNVVLVMTDDQGYGDVGLHGNEKIRTPILDRFAREGIELTRFYCEQVCSPTRASLMTGRSFYRTGVLHTSRGAAKMHGDEVTVAELLRDAGYATGIFGKWHLGDNYPMRPQDQGFAETLVHRSGGIGQTPDVPNSYFDSLLWKNGQEYHAQGYCTDVFFDAALDFIERHRDEPFFVYLPTNAPHSPLEVSPKYSDPYIARGLPENTARVYGMVENIDENFGRLIEKLDALHLRENTLLIFLSDNGPAGNRYNAGLRGRKGTVYEAGMRVPFYVQWPAAWQGGRQIDRIAAHIDVLPTVLEACGVERPSHPAIDGVSVVPLLAGTAGSWPERLLYFQCHRGLMPKRYQNFAVIGQRYKLLGYPGTFSDEDLEPSATEPVLELYDLLADEGESHDLADEQPKVVAALQAAYNRWFDDVRGTRGFTPGWIRFDPAAENPVHFCRYQDGNFVDGVPHGWNVELQRKGRYEVQLDRRGKPAVGTLVVDWCGQRYERPLAAESDGAEFELPAGEGVIDVRFEPTGRPAGASPAIAGDVELRWLD